jgi:hypothetical protein
MLCACCLSMERHILPFDHRMPEPCTTLAPNNVPQGPYPGPAIALIAYLYDYFSTSHASSLVALRWEAYFSFSLGLVEMCRHASLQDWRISEDQRLHTAYVSSYLVASSL